MPSRFVPDSWTLSDKLRQWTLDYRHEGKRIDPSTIDDLEERFRDIEFPKPRRCFDRCWRRFIRNSIKWEQVKLIAPQRRPQELTQDDRKQAQMAFDNDPKIIEWRKRSGAE